MWDREASTYSSILASFELRYLLHILIVAFTAKSNCCPTKVCRTFASLAAVVVQQALLQVVMHLFFLLLLGDYCT